MTPEEKYARVKGLQPLQVLYMREHDIDMLTIGQYLQPSKEHLPVQRFVHPDEFEEYRLMAEKLGFKHAACGPLVRSSYHADKQAHGEEVR